MTEDSSVESAESSDSGDNSDASTNYEVRKILQMYSDSGFASHVRASLKKTTLRTTSFAKRLIEGRL